ncbi:hypothetical protein ACQKIE_18565 [Luteibacter sp. NPDC031894]|uniref:hypothetical protein n=1 Tax=Luteibacter sp. NPDC031894 TaxID=3390572 RepID=UPI003D00669B
MANAMTRYYRADTAHARAAWAVYREDCDRLATEAEALAAAFPGSVPVYSTSFHGRSFYGLRFETEMPRDTWTAPDRDGKTQHPRANARKIVGIDKVARRQEWERICAVYDATRPTTRPNLDPVFRDLGTDWGTLLFCGCSLFEHAGILYLATSAEVGAPCEEITGGQYFAAQRSSKS